MNTILATASGSRMNRGNWPITRLVAVAFAYAHAGASKRSTNVWTLHGSDVRGLSLIAACEEAYSCGCSTIRSSVCAHRKHHRGDGEALAKELAWTPKSRTALL